MKTSAHEKATFAEVIGSIKFAGKATVSHSHPWPNRGLAVSQSTHMGEMAAHECKLVRSSN